MPDTKLGKKSVDGADLDAVAATLVVQFGGVDMIAPRWNDHGKGGKAFDDLPAGPRSPKTLQ